MSGMDVFHSHDVHISSMRHRGTLRRNHRGDIREPINVIKDTMALEGHSRELNNHHDLKSSLFMAMGALCE